MHARVFAPPGDRLILTTNEPRLGALAARLWDDTDDAGDSPMALRYEARPVGGAGAADEERVIRIHGETHYTFELPGLFHARLDLETHACEGWLADVLFDSAPSLVARVLLEAPAAVFLSRRGFTVLHAGAVAGPGGVAVLRGAGGAGKSTLVAAAWRAGLSVLGDETILASREDPDFLASSVRELALRPDSAALLSLRGATSRAFSGGEEKRRVDLLPSSSPAARRGRRAAAVLLGPLEPGPARLVPLRPEDFEAGFREGAIAEESRAGDPAAIAKQWGARNAFRLEGALDLTGAVSLITSLVA